MCRLLAWRSPHPICPEDLLGADRGRLADLSRVHCDGWGVGFADGDDSLVIERGAEPAHLDPTFLSAIRAHRAPAGMVHLRWATEDLAVNLGNTHPFSASYQGEPLAFVHNGMLPDSADLLPDIDADLVRGFRGDTDSERYFGLFATEFRREGGDIAAAMQKTAKRLSDVAYTSLNAMILTPRTLAVACLFKPENRPLDEEQDYFDLTWEARDGLISAWSTGVRPSVTHGQPLDNRTLLVVDITSGDFELVPID